MYRYWASISSSVVGHSEEGIGAASSTILEVRSLLGFRFLFLFCLLIIQGRSISLTFLYCITFLARIEVILRLHSLREGSFINRCFCLNPDVDVKLETIICFASLFSFLMFAL